VEKFMEDENSITEEEINKALRAAGYGYHSISRSSIHVRWYVLFSS
jgi:hypothetical protein